MEGGQSWLPGGAELDAETMPCPFPRHFLQSLACCPRSFCFCILPVYLVPIVSPLVPQYAFSAPSSLLPTQTYITWALSPCQSLLFVLSSLYSHSSLCPNCSGCCWICRRRSPRRISSSELARRVLTSTRPSSMALSSRNTLNPRLRKTTRGHWASGMGKFTALTPHDFRKKPLDLTPSYLQQIRPEPPWR